MQPTGSREAARAPRDGSLDALRGLGALVVLAHHVALAFAPHAVMGSLQRRNAPWEDALHLFPGSLAVAGKFAVEVFFVLSGVVLSRRFLGPGMRPDEDIAAAALKRGVRLLPMVIAGILAVAGAMWLGALRNQEAGDATGSTMWLKARAIAPSSPSYVARVVLGNPLLRGGDYDSPLWTIGAELTGSYIVFGLVFVARRSAWRWAIYAAAGVWLRGAWTLPFVAGVVLSDLDASFPAARSWAARARVWVPALAAALYLGSYPLVLDDASRARWCAWVPWLARLRGLNIAAGAVLLVSLVLGSPALRRALDHAPGRWLGRVSYALYALHEPVLLTLGCGVYLALAPGRGHGVAAAAGAGATLAVALVVAELGTRWIDLPSQRWADALARWYRRTLRPAGG